ncbi:hypothetical protein D3981_004358 [Escherichia coli]|nr:hypothetical protein [Escherichia coli]
MIKELLTLAKAIDENEREKTPLQSICDLFLLSSVSFLGVYILQHHGIFILDINILDGVPDHVYFYAYGFIVFMFLMSVAVVWKHDKI